jgi:hypothetical protein
MKITDIITEAEAKKRTPKPKKSSGAVRYNSEVGLMAGFMRVDAQAFNPAQPEASMPAELLQDPDAVFKDIKKLLAPEFDPTIFTKWHALGTKYGYAMHGKLVNSSRRVTAFGWAGGSNKSESGPSDVEFIGSDVAGVSVKEEGGITLANLTPTSVGLGTEHGEDVFGKFANSEFISMKRNIFSTVLQLAQQQPDQPIAALDPKYSVTFISESGLFKCIGKKKTIEVSADEILKSIGTNAAWQRPFGDWFQANFMEYRHFSDPLFNKISTIFTNIIEESLKDSSKLKTILQFSKIPYFYATPRALYYIPSYDEVDDIEVKGIRYAAPDGTGQLFKALIGRKDALPHAVAEMDIYIRYANGMFQTNPTVRVQSLKNPQYIAWEKLV